MGSVRVRVLSRGRISPNSADSSSRAASLCAASLRAVWPRVISSRAVWPRVISRRAVWPRVISPRAVRPRAVSRRTVSPRAVSLCGVVPRAVWPRPVWSFVISPRVISSRAVSSGDRPTPKTASDTPPAIPVATSRASAASIRRSSRSIILNDYTARGCQNGRRGLPLRLTPNNRP